MSLFFDLSNLSKIIDWATHNVQSNEVLLILVAAKSQHQVHEMLRQFQQHNIQAFGGIFSQVIFDQKLSETGCVVAQLKAWGEPTMIGGLDQIPIDLTRVPNVKDIPSNHALTIFADADAPHLAECLNQLYGCLGQEVKYFGGGAGLLGDLSPEQKLCVFTTNDGFAENAAVLAFINHAGVVSANHGWQRLYGPLIATRTEGNVLLELNWQPAFDVYRQVVEEQIGHPLLPEDIGTQLSLGFPFGMLKQDSEDLVRLPIAVTDTGGVVCVGGIHTNCVLYILQGTPDLVLGAAHQTIQDCALACNQTSHHKLLIDCVTRYWFLNERYTEELNAIVQGLSGLGPAPVIGALSKGEIASSGVSYLEMLNKSVAIGTFI